MLVRWTIALMAAMLAAPAAVAQAWPDKPIRFLMSAPAGSSIDVLGRAIADKLKDRLGQPVVVENKPAAGGTVRQHIGLKRGLTAEQAKEISKIVREAFPKTKPAIQGDAVRVTGKSRDELQAVIAHLRGLDYPVALQFENYR